MKVSCMRKLLAITLITSITFTSCVSWHNGNAREIEEYPTKKMKSEEKKTTIAFQTRCQLVGLIVSDARRHSSVDYTDTMAQDVFEEGGYFIYSNDASTSDYVLVLTVRSDSARGEIYKLLLSVLTATVIPAFETHKFTITAQIRDRQGNNIARRVIKQEIHIFYQLFTLPAMPFVAWPRSVVDEMFRQIMTDLAVWAYEEIENSRKMNIK